MLCVAAWVWFCLSTEFVVVPLVGGTSSGNAETADAVCGSMGLVLSIYRVYRHAADSKAAIVNDSKAMLKSICC